MNIKEQQGFIIESLLLSHQIYQHPSAMCDFDEPAILGTDFYSHRSRKEVCTPFLPWGAYAPQEP